jgi:protein O-mannosyl-transferase
LRQAGGQTGPDRFCMGKKTETKNHHKRRKSEKEDSAQSFKPAGNKRRFLHNPVVHILFIALVAFLAYSNSFHVPFSFDDVINIVENPDIRDGRLLTGPLKQYHEKLRYETRYIGFFTFALNYKFHGLQVAGYHIVNFVIHLFNALLVYLFVLYTFRTPFLNKSALKDYAGFIAFFSALLFAVHPLNTQAVTYIVQRLTSLAAFFYLLSVVFYIKWRLMQKDADYSEPDTGDKKGALHFIRLLLYSASVLSAVLAMKTKEMSFTLPFMIMLYEFFFFDGSIRKRLLHLTPLILTGLIIPFSVINAGNRSGAVFSNIEGAARLQTEISRWDYLFTQFRVVMTYLRLLIFPAKQNFDYDYPVYHSFFEPAVFLSFLFLLSICGTGIYLWLRYRNKSPYTRIISFGIFWFFIALSVESSLLPIADVIFEHRMYLPSIGIFMALTAALYGVVHAYRDGWKNMEMTVAGILLCICVIFAGATHARNDVWRDNVSLWEDVVKKSPAKARVNYNLGMAYEDKGLYDKALEQFYIALKINPNDGKSYYHLGSVYLNKGLFDKAIEQYRIALKLMPDNASFHYNLGTAYLYKGLYDRSIEEYNIALKLKPDYASAYNNMGNAYMQKGLFDKAVECYRTALKLLPDYADAYGNLGNAYLHEGLADKAIEQYQAALRLMPNNADAHFNLGLAYLKNRENGVALNEFQTALRLNPALKEAEDYINSISGAGNKGGESRGIK